MGACPACGFDNPDGTGECARCHLSVGLFDAVREAAGEDPDQDPKFVQTIGELLSQLGEPPAAPEVPGGATILYPHRFPSVPSATPGPVAEPPPAALGGLPALPPAGDVPLLLRQVNDYMQLARRQSVDLTPFTERARAALLSQDRATLEALTRDLFVHLAAALTDEYERTLARRNEIAGLVPTASIDVELEGCRGSLALGDFPGAQRRLRHVEEMTSDLEEQWATVQILVTESDLLAETIRSLGGDPTPALGPLAEGRRRAREGDRTGAEPVLARAALALWSILNPLFQRELARLKDALLARRGRGEEIGPAVVLLRQLAADLRHRNFASAVISYRNLRDTLAGPAGVADDRPAPSAAEVDARPSIDA